MGCTLETRDLPELLYAEAGLSPEVERSAGELLARAARRAGGALTMHESPIVQELLDTALRHAAEHHATRVAAVHLRLGELSAITADSVQFYWDHMSEGTICEGATLHFTSVPAQVQCLDCGHTASLGPDTEACPACGGLRLQLTGGEEFVLESLDLDAPGPQADA
jgi:hydrogenase nickel incorporation protein HypA/HybF